MKEPSFSTPPITKLKNEMRSTRDIRVTDENKSVNVKEKKKPGTEKNDEPKRNRGNIRGRSLHSPSIRNETGGPRTYFERDKATKPYLIN